MKKVQKLNKSFINIQNIRIVPTLNSSLKPHNDLSRPCFVIKITFYVTYLTLNQKNWF